MSPDFEPNFEGWRRVARQYLVDGVEPSLINWRGSAALALPGLLDEAKPLAKVKAAPRISREFIKLAQEVACARDDARWALLYRILWRIQHENRDLLKIVVDDDVDRATRLAASVRRDIHKMHAFVRFKLAPPTDEGTIGSEDVPRYVAWHKPEHFICEAAAPFFARRFGDRCWSIFTPDASAHWNLLELQFGPGLERSKFDFKDGWEDTWKTYYRSIFNPARIKIKAMKSEMSPKYWSTMPETALIADLIREAPARLQTMRENHRTQAVVQPTGTLEDAREQAMHCRACPLYARATQTVFGRGPSSARMMIVGEQPGDVEDRAGEPFVGPAGKVLDDALAVAGIHRSEIYLTNAVKHFKWREQAGGKRRLHEKPSGSEMHACRPWLAAEIERVQPLIIVALGGTAATSILGRLPKISEERGRIQARACGDRSVMVSWHPSSILRAPTPNDANEKRRQLGEDLACARESLSHYAEF